MFHSKPLNELVELSLSNNPTIKAGQAALTVARESVLAQKGSYYPNIAAAFSAARQKTSEELAPIPNSTAVYFNLYTPQSASPTCPTSLG